MEMKVEKKKIAGNWESRMMFLFFVMVLILSVGLSFFRFFVLRDYPIQSQIECDPYTESCFIYHCDSAVEECTGDSVADTSYYKLLDRNAHNIPLCNPVEESCTPLICPDWEEGCVVTFCDATTDETVECTNPEEYSAEYPVVENPEEVMDKQLNPEVTDSNIMPVE